MPAPDRSHLTDQRMSRNPQTVPLIDSMWEIQAESLLLPCRTYQRAGQAVRNGE